MIKTGKLYKKLFSDYSEELFNKSVDLQMERFKRWNLPVKDSVCLDVGCGGGRTLVALKKMGAKEVHGIDIDDELVKLAKERSGADVIKGSVLDLPYKPNSFDLVICSGVLHHTPDIKKGIREIYDVLKPGGTLYLLLYLKHPRWIFTKFMRLVGKIVPFNLMRKLLFFIPANKRYNIMDNWYVEYMQVLDRERILNMVDYFVEVKEVDRNNPEYNIRLVLKK